MKPGKSSLYFALFMAMAPALAAQEADTSSQGYQIGYQIGSWLPFSIIVLLAVLLILKSRRQYGEK